ncbi:MAG: hypothetical protein R2752_14965 [Vicinamibacterales bacterium]
MPTAGYSGTPLVRKLGVKPGMTLALLRAPAGFRRELVGLPDDVAVRTRASGRPDLVVWFVDRRRDLERDVARMARLMGHGLWIAWPKQASGVITDVTGDVVRTTGLRHGLVDYKVCAINDTWSGLKFARRADG